MKHDIEITQAVEALPDDAVGPLLQLFSIMQKALTNREKRLVQIENYHLSNRRLSHKIDAVVAAEIENGATLDEIIDRYDGFSDFTDAKRLASMYRYIKPDMTRRARERRDDYIMQLYRLGRPYTVIARAVGLSTKQISRIAKELRRPADISARDKQLKR